MSNVGELRTTGGNMPKEPKRRAEKWDLNIPDWLKWLEPMLLRLLEPLFEKYLTKFQDKSTAWVRENHGDALADTWKEIFWKIVDELDDEIELDLDDLTPDK